MNQHNDQPGTQATSQLPTHTSDSLTVNPHWVETNKAIKASRRATYFIPKLFYFLFLLFSSPSFRRLYLPFRVFWKVFTGLMFWKQLMARCSGACHKASQKCKRVNTTC